MVPGTIVRPKAFDVVFKVRNAEYRAVLYGEFVDAKKPLGMFGDCDARQWAARRVDERYNLCMKRVLRGYIN